MDTRIESDIASIKAAVSGYPRHDAKFVTLEAQIERLKDELRDCRAKIHELDIFQTIAKGVLAGIGAVVVIVFIVAIFKAAAFGPSNESATKTDASQPADAALPGTR
jgi:hypothetical protein